LLFPYSTYIASIELLKEDQQKQPGNKLTTLFDF